MGVRKPSSYRHSLASRTVARVRKNKTKGERCCCCFLPRLGVSVLALDAQARRHERCELPVLLRPGHSLDSGLRERENRQWRECTSVASLGNRISRAWRGGDDTIMDPSEDTRGGIFPCVRRARLAGDGCVGAGLLHGRLRVVRRGLRDLRPLRLRGAVVGLLLLVHPVGGCGGVRGVPRSSHFKNHTLYVRALAE